jgi:hypothetical protein
VQAAGINCETYIGGPRTPAAAEGGKKLTEVTADKDTQRQMESLARALYKDKGNRLPVITVTA